MLVVAGDDSVYKSLLANAMGRALVSRVVSVQAPLESIRACAPDRIVCSEALALGEGGLLDRMEAEHAELLPRLEILCASGHAADWLANFLASRIERVRVNILEEPLEEELIEELIARSTKRCKEASRVAAAYHGGVAFGFPAYHQEDVTFPFPVTHDWVIYACQVGGLGMARWGAGGHGGMWHVSPSVSLLSWGENMTIAPLAPNIVRIRSECGLPTQCIDWGKNERNVKRLVQVLWAAVQQTAQPPFR